MNPELRNPYRWDSHQIASVVEIERTSLLDEATKRLLGGSSVVLLGGRGMGKSVFLRQLERQLASEPTVRVVLIPDPPVEADVGGVLAVLAGKLGIEPTTGIHDGRKLLDAYFGAHPEHRHLVLLFDELDQYAGRSSHGGSNLGRELLNHLEAVRKDVGNLGILAAGGLGIFLLRNVLGSPFFARVSWFQLEPFDDNELARLALPFAERGTSLTDDVLTALRVVSGGIPALVTYGLESLWSRPEPDPSVIAEIFARFEQDHHEFIRVSLSSLTARAFSDIPHRVLAVIQSAQPPIARQRLLEATRRSPESASDFDLHDTLRLLRAAGLVHVVGSAAQDPVSVRPIASILNFSREAPSGGGDFTERLSRALVKLLEQLHAMGADFFRPGSKRQSKQRQSKQLVPESVFRAFVALGLAATGWDVEREALSAAGRTDIKVRRAGDQEVGIIEFKIWGRPRYKETHQQILGYWERDVAAMLVVMLSDEKLDDWPGNYRTNCLSGTTEVDEVKHIPPLRGHFVAGDTTPDGARVCVEHLLLCVPRAIGN